MRRFAASLLTASLIVVGFAACGSNNSGTSSAPGPSASESGPPSLSGSITVFAAASLTESFTELGKQFESANQGTKVTFSFAASSALAEQINSGAPADVFASASPKNMDQVVDAGGALDPKVFATNKMEIATPPSNPGDVASINDLAKSSVKTALCQPQVPCGSVAQQVFTNAKITVKPVTLEPDVKSC